MNAKKFAITRTGESEPFQIIYADLESIFPGFAGDFLMTTCGDPETRISLEDAAANADSDETESAINEELAEIESIISGDDGEELDEEDLEYLRDWMRIFGVIE